MNNKSEALRSSIRSIFKYTAEPAEAVSAFVKLLSFLASADYPLAMHSFSFAKASENSPAKPWRSRTSTPPKAGQYSAKAGKVFV